jgi:hypothetical protein
MNQVSSILAHLLEAEEDDFGIKEVEPTEPVAGRAQVTRHGRWKVVDMPHYTFMVSYLTPVAYYDKLLDAYYETRKQWSPTTNGHIQQWKHQIFKSPEWNERQDNKEWEPPTEWRPEGYWRTNYPKFSYKKQAEISALFKKLMATMELKPREKKRLYHVAPVMRAGSEAARRASQWVSGHGKHHDSGEEGLPRPGDWRHREDPDLGKFFADFEPDEAEMWDWQQSERRSQEPHEPE